ncbi:MAG: hypothetical protein U0X39_07715 [Bacteroidales bacterium]
MKSRILKSVFVMFILLVYSCNEPETIVTDIVHPDGSVTRIIESRSGEDNIIFDTSPVPIDSTWTIKDTIEISNGKDTTWIRRAEKLFKDVNELNASYSEWKGLDNEVERSASFEKKFRWFHTVYVFSENFSRALEHGYPMDKFMNKEEISFYYLPDQVYKQMEAGKDSLAYGAMKDTISKREDAWIWRSLISEWIENYTALTSSIGGAGQDSSTLRSREEMAAHLMTGKGDSAAIAYLVGPGNFEKYKKEIDSTNKIVEKRFNVAMEFSKYTVRMKMPGEIISTNGYPAETGELVWPARSEFFLTTDHSMVAESKVVNYWAWVISGIFIVFVVTGILLRIFRK